MRETMQDFFYIVGRKIKELRKRYGYNQSKVAEIIDVNHSQLSKIERGKQDLKISALIKLANFFKVNPAYFLTDDRREPRD